jgi:hypothetical protein
VGRNIDGKMTTRDDTIIEAIIAGRSWLRPFRGCRSASVHGDSDYFYLAAKPDARPGTLVACDYYRNHAGDGRAYLTNGTSTNFVSEANFQEMLKRPENAEFTKALREAEPDGR